MRKSTQRRFVGAAPGTGRWLLISSVVLAVLVAPFAFAAGEGRPIDGGERNPSSNKSLAYTKETGILTSNGTYGTRQSNKKDGDGGGAIYGCRSAPGREPCIRANNLKNGRAFEFDTRSGTQGGYIDVGSGNPNANATPFGTNAAGKVANLNADRVDDLHADEIIARAKDQWAVVGLRRSADPQERRHRGDQAWCGRLRGRVRGQRGLLRLQRDARHRRHDRPARRRGGRLAAHRQRQRGARGDPRQRRRRGRPPVPPDCQLLT